MAIAIRSIPTLDGDDAVRFMERADAAERNTNRTDFSQYISQVQEYLRSQNL